MVIGGDGSLTGADLFRQEWSSLLEELVTTGMYHSIIIDEILKTKFYFKILQEK